MLQCEKLNFLLLKFKKTPIANKPIILIIVLILTGFFSLTAKGIATPIINKNPGKIRSAGVKPFHYA